jgi:D-alanyl-D-alanine carboxypeptidase
VKRIVAIALAVWVAGTASAAPVTEDVRALANGAGFDGTILIGNADGSHHTLTLGDRPVREDAVWRWASITKQLAAVIAMQEVARGRLDLDSPVSRYWPDWPSPAANRLRIRDLLTHRSGLPQPDESTPDAKGVPAFYGAGAAAPSASAAGFCAGQPRTPLPAKFHYNNCDTLLVAEVLRRITGRSFERLVRERIVRPLKARSVGVYALGRRPKQHVAPTGAYSDIDGLLDMGVYGASGGAYGTIGDLWRFDRALLDGRLLGANERETMWESNMDTGFSGMFQWVFPATLTGCARPVRIVERQGLIGGIAHRNYLVPETRQAVIMFARRRPIEYGDPWEGKGFAHQVLSRVVCG